MATRYRQGKPQYISRNVTIHSTVVDLHLRSIDPSNPCATVHETVPQGFLLMLSEAKRQLSPDLAKFRIISCTIKLSHQQAIFSNIAVKVSIFEIF